jgi:nucleoside 2-deoxyribosyltransferase
MERPRSICVYLAGPLFTQAEWQWNQRLAEALQEHSLQVILPQDGAAPMLSGEKEFNARGLFDQNLQSIDRSDVVVALFDGPDVDSGTAWECGYAFKSAKPVVGVRTDIRAGGDDPQAAINLMLSISCSQTVVVPLKNRTNLLVVAECIAEAVRRAVS